MRRKIWRQFVVLNILVILRSTANLKHYFPLKMEFEHVGCVARFATICSKKREKKHTGVLFLLFSHVLNSTNGNKLCIVSHVKINIDQYLAVYRYHLNFSGNFCEVLIRNFVLL